MPHDFEDGQGLPIRVYDRHVHKTDRLPADSVEVVLLGLFGEIGSILAIEKKRKRDVEAFSRYLELLNEEFGDTLWYLSCASQRLGASLDQLTHVVDSTKTTHTFKTLASLRPRASASAATSAPMALADAVGKVVASAGVQAETAELLDGLAGVLRGLLDAAADLGVDLDAAAQLNVEKVSGWKSRADGPYPPLFDEGMGRREQLPRQFSIEIEEVEIQGKTFVFQSCNGIQIGDRLTDNKTEQDDYRFHDVFHIAYAVHLGWSPVLRSLFKAKRKSKPELDENEDGARALIIEEGISTIVFGHATRYEPKYFDGLKKVDPDLIKLVCSLVRGFEPEACAPWQWERAILDGFRVFRHLKKERKGTIRADLVAHRLEFDPL